MVVNNADSIRKQMIAETDDFIACRLNDARTGWPLRTVPSDGPQQTPTGRGHVSGLNTLIVGELAMEFPLEVEATQAELLQLLRSRDLNQKMPWSLGDLRVGGFVGHATRLASALGADISVRAVLPAPVPRCFEQFLDTHKVGRRELLAVPGPCPVVLQMRCKDGHFSVPRSGVASMLSPMNASQVAGYHVIMAAPGPSTSRVEVIRSLTANGRCTGDLRTVALQVDDRWSWPDLIAAGQKSVWTFVDRRDAELLSGNSGGGPFGSDAQRVLAFKNAYHIDKVVMTLGSRGAVMMNGEPHPFHVRTCPIDESSCTGCSAVLTAATAISSAAGADDKTSLRRGVAAATGLAAGLPLPLTLEELDVD